MNDHLHKPLRYETMIQCISQWIRLPDLDKTGPKQQTKAVDQEEDGSPSLDIKFGCFA